MALYLWYVYKKTATRNQMKVLYISTADYKYGAGKAQASMILELKNRFDIEPVILTKKYNSFNKYCDEHGIENYSYWYRDIMAGSAYSSPVLNVFKHVVKYMLYLGGSLTQKGVLNCGIDWDKIDIIHSNHIRIDIGAYISRKTGIPHIWHIRELNRGHVKIIHYKQKCYQYINKNADAFIAVTNQTKECWCEAGLDKEKVRVVYDGIDAEKFTVKKQRNDGKLKLVCVGRIEKSKGQLQILEAITRLPDNIKNNISLDLIGEPYPDYLHQLQEFIQVNDISEQINFLGYCSNVAELLCNYDVGILSSKGDAFGTVTGEYMASGLVAIATYTELVRHKETGLRYEFEDIDKLAENICFVYRNKMEAAKIAMQGNNEIRGKYTVAKNAGEVYQIYKKVLRDEG